MIDIEQFLNALYSLQLQHLTEYKLSEIELVNQLHIRFNQRVTKEQLKNSILELEQKAANPISLNFCRKVIEENQTYYIINYGTDILEDTINQIENYFKQYAPGVYELYVNVFDKVASAIIAKDPEEVLSLIGDLKSDSTNQLEAMSLLDANFDAGPGKHILQILPKCEVKAKMTHDGLVTSVNQLPLKTKVLPSLIFDNIVNTSITLENVFEAMCQITIARPTEGVKYYDVLKLLLRGKNLFHEQLNFACHLVVTKFTKLIELGYCYICHDKNIALNQSLTVDAHFSLIENKKFDSTNFATFINLDGIFENAKNKIIQCRKATQINIYANPPVDPVEYTQVKNEKTLINKALRFNAQQMNAKNRLLVATFLKLFLLNSRVAYSFKDFLVSLDQDYEHLFCIESKESKTCLMLFCKSILCCEYLFLERVFMDENVVNYVVKLNNLKLPDISDFDKQGEGIIPLFSSTVSSIEKLEKSKKIISDSVKCILLNCLQYSKFQFSKDEIVKFLQRAGCQKDDVDTYLLEMQFFLSENNGNYSIRFSEEVYHQIISLSTSLITYYSSAQGNYLQLLKKQKENGIPVQDLNVINSGSVGRSLLIHKFGFNFIENKDKKRKYVETINVDSDCVVSKKT